MAAGDTLLNALIGAVVSVVLAFLPFSTVLGGGVAGYLHKGTRDEGLRVGAISGLIAMIPMFLFASLFGGLFFFSMLGVGPQGLMGMSIFFVIAVLLMILYTVALSAVGGYLGAYVATETDLA